MEMKHMVLEECFKKIKKNLQKEEKVDQEKRDQEKGDQEKVEGRNQVDSLVGFKVIL